METQADYETEATIAVLGTEANSEAAVVRLQAMGIPAYAIRRSRPPPDLYQCLDTSLSREFASLFRASAVGVALGAVFGIGVGVWSELAGAASAGLLAAIGAGMGGMIGSIFGAETGARYDDDTARFIDLRGASTVEIVSVRTHSYRDALRAQEAFWRCGALALLDPTCLPSSLIQ